MKKITFIQLVFLTMAFFASIRRIPNLAYAGWETIFYMIFAVLMFVIPVSLISASLATAMPKEGGLGVWISTALGEKWGFAASFLVWMQMCFGMVTVGAAFSDMIATMFGATDLLKNNVFIGLVVICLYWLITFLIIKGVPITAISTYGAIFGLIIPLALILIFGTIYTTSHTSSALPPLSLDAVIPNFRDPTTLAKLTGIIFLFAGMEQASSFSSHIDNPRKNYPRALILATFLIAILFTYAGLIAASIIPADKMILSDTAQIFTLIFSSIPIMSTIIAAMIAIGCITEMSAWTLGPSKSMLSCARQGILPPKFQDAGKNGIPKMFLIVQAIIISFIALIFVLIPGTNNVYSMILAMAVVLYCIVYFLILFSGIKYFKKMANLGGKKDKKNAVRITITALVGMIGVAIVFIVSFVPPTQTSSSFYTLFIIIGTIVFFAIPIIIFKFKKPEWKNVSILDKPPRT